MTKKLKHSVILLATILLMVPATVSISQITDMEKTNQTLNLTPATVNENPISELTAGTTALAIETAGQTPAAMIMIGMGLIAAAVLVRKKLEKTIHLNRSASRDNYQSAYDRSVLSRG